MLTLRRSAVLALLSLSSLALAQGKANDIPVEELPPEVKAVLEEYVKILRSSADLDAAAKAVTAVTGGSLVNEDGATLRATVQPYSLKKDFNNIKFYADPLKITRVNKGKSGGSGFGPSAIAGTTYKIWIAKKEGGAGMPAPVTIMVPEGHATIKTPKVVNIGSF